MKITYFLYAVLLALWPSGLVLGQILEVQSGASVTIGTGASLTATGGTISNSGSIDGGGLFSGTFTNGTTGTVAPGGSPGCITYIGDFTNNGKLEIELADGTVCTNFDRIIVNGNAVINGTIEITFIGGIAPATSTFTVATATGTLTASPIITWPVGYTGTYSIVGGNELQVSFSSLPVELTDFRAVLQKDNTVLLLWQTESETINKGFDIEHSTDGTDWNQLGFVEGHGTTTDAQLYSFTDIQPVPGLNYYRLKQVDFNGQFEYSSITSVDLQEADRLSGLVVYPNPIRHSRLTIHFPYELETESAISLHSPSGQLVKQLQSNSQTEMLDISGMSAGIYSLKITNGQEVVFEKVVIQ